MQKIDKQYKKHVCGPDLSMSAFLMVVDAAAWGASVILKMLSITFSSVAVVSIPQKAAQSFTNRPAARELLPRFTVPA